MKTVWLCKCVADQWACPDAETCVLQNGQATIQNTSEQDDNSESTDSTSKVTPSFYCNGG